MTRGKRSDANTKKKGRKKKKRGSLKTIKEGYHRTKTIVLAKAKKKMQRGPSRIEGRVRSRIASQTKSRIASQKKSQMKSRVATQMKMTKMTKTVAAREAIVT